MKLGLLRKSSKQDFSCCASPMLNVLQIKVIKMQQNDQNIVLHGTSLINLN